MEMKTWTATTIEDPDDPEGVILPLPEEMMSALDWREGDVLLWDVQEDGSVVVSNKSLEQRQADAVEVVARCL